MRLDTELERNGDSPVRAGDRAKAIVHGVAERLGGGIESADVQEHRIGRGAEAPAVEVGRAVQPLVEPAEQVHRDEREREPAVEPEPVWSPVELQVERWLPGAGARVARGDLAELAGEAALDGGRGTREQRAHGARDGGIRGDGGIEHEGAVVARAVAVDVGPDHRRVRRAGRQAADSGDLDRPGDRIRDGAQQGVAPLEAARGPLADVGIAGGARGGEPLRGGARSERRLVLRACVRIGQLERHAARGEAAEPQRQLFRVRLEIGPDHEHLAERGMQP